MSKKIAKIDNDAMNSLYGVEFARLAGRKIADKVQESEAGRTLDPQAFADHSEYLSVLKSVLAEDGSTDHDPNDPLKD
jgi:hypothetical protein